MAAPIVTIKVKAGEALMNRIREVCEYLDISPANFIEFAIENELSAQENHRTREDITLEEIRGGILSGGQSMEIAMHDGDHATCALCLAPIDTPRKVEGPLLCENCMNLAQGPDLKAVSTGM